MTDQTADPGSRTENIVAYLAKSLNVVSAVWLIAIALLILYDVTARELFQKPFPGTNELVSNSVLSILMLQLPLAILSRSSLRTTILYQHLGDLGRRLVDVFSYLLGALLFLVIAVGSWPNMIEGWAIREQEGSGVITIPVYPIRTLVIVVSVIGIAVCALLIYQTLSRRAESPSASD